MAGRGPAPKAAAQRRRTNEPARGEWIDVHPPTEGVPSLPPGTWPARTRAAWNSWWSDPAASQWTSADHGAVADLAHLHAGMAEGTLSLAKEVRQRMDILGLTQKGKRDLRWRVTVEPSEAEVVRPAPVRRLRAVEAG